MRDESHYVEKFLLEIRALSDRPYRFDDVTIERLVDSVSANESNLHLVNEAMSGIDVESSKFSSIVCLKLLNKFCRSNFKFGETQVMVEFLKRCVDSAQLGDYSLLNSILQFLCSFEKLNGRSSLRAGAANLAVTCLQSEKMSIFVKKTAADYCKLLIHEGENCLDLLPLVSVLVDCEGTVDCVAQLFIACASSMSDETAEEICHSAPKKLSFCSAYACLLAALFERNGPHRSLLGSEDWRCHRLKLAILRIMVSNGCADVVPSLLAEPDLVLGDVVPCVPHLSDQDRERLMNDWTQLLHSEKKCSTEDVRDLLLLRDSSDAFYNQIYDALLKRFWKSPELLSLMIERNRHWAFQKQNEIVSLAFSGLTSLEWEKRDTAIEFLRFLPDIKLINADELFKKLCEMTTDDDNPFVRANVLRFVGEQRPNAILSIATRAATNELFSEPRLEGVRILLKGLPESQKWCFEVLPTVLQDDDAEVRHVAVLIAAKLASMGGECERFSKQCLAKYLQDESAWQKDINLALGNETIDDNTAKRKNAVDMLKEALEKLSLPADASDSNVMDCY